MWVYHQSNESLLGGSFILQSSLPAAKCRYLFETSDQRHRLDFLGTLDEGWCWKRFFYSRSSNFMSRVGLNGAYFSSGRHLAISPTLEILGRLAGFGRG